MIVCYYWKTNIQIQIVKVFVKPVNTLNALGLPVTHSKLNAGGARVAGGEQSIPMFRASVCFSDYRQKIVYVIVLWELWRPYSTRRFYFELSVARFPATAVKLVLCLICSTFIRCIYYITHTQYFIFSVSGSSVSIMIALFRFCGIDFDFKNVAVWSTAFCIGSVNIV